MDVSFSELWESVMDREAWHAVIHGVAKSRTRLSDWTELNWNAEEGVENKEPSYTVIGNVIWYSHNGEHYGSFLKN